MKYLFLLTLISFILLACNKRVNHAKNGDITPDSVSTIQDTVTTRNAQNTDSIRDTNSLRAINEEVVKALARKDYWKFGNYIHPEKGVRFSMYGYVRPERDKIFSLSDYRKYINTDVKFTFGERDGTGDPHVTTLKNYLSQWVYKRDFTGGKYYENSFRGAGNSLNNLKEIYPGLNFTENYIEGSEKYSGMDWNSLRLVFEEFNGKYFLVAVVNDEWTI